MDAIIDTHSSSGHRQVVRGSGAHSALPTAPAIFRPPSKAADGCAFGLRSPIRR
jgi:hypothetical protein